MLLGALGVLGSNTVLARAPGEDLGGPDDPIPLKLSRSLGDLPLAKVGAGNSKSDSSGFRLKASLTLSPSDILVRSGLKGTVQSTIGAAPAIAFADSGKEPESPRLSILDASEVQGAQHGLANQSDDTRQPEDPVPFDPKPAAAAPRQGGQRDERPPVPVAAQKGLPDIEGEVWQFAPIRWIGTTTSSGNYFLPEGSGKSFTVFNNLNVQASSFVVAPYIAQWTGSFGASSSSTTTSPVSGSAVKNEGSSLNFGGNVDVFPMSRFPFSASISRSSAESRTAESTSPTSSLTLGLRQQYRTEDGRDNYSVNFNRNSVSTGLASALATSVVSSLGGNFSTTREFDYEHWLEGNHNISANFNTSSAQAGPTAGIAANAGSDRAVNLNANLTHGWNVHEDLNINNLLTFARSEINAFQGNALTRNRSSVLLGSSAFTWRPIEGMPLTLTGGGNFSSTSTVNNNRTSDQGNLGTFVSTNYRFNDNVSVGGNASMSSTDSAGLRNTSTVQAANVAYTGDPLNFGGFIYGWGAGGGFSRSTSSAAGSQVGTTLSASHNLARTIPLERLGDVNLSASQNVSRTTNPNGAVTSLSNSAGAGWRATFGEQLSANLNGNVVLTMSDGAGGKNQFRSANLTGAGAYQISSRAAINLTTNLSWNQSLIDNNTNQLLNGVTVNSNAPLATGSFSIGYTHQSPFSIRNLNYNGSFTRIQSFSNLNVAGGSTPLATNNASNSFQQLVDYRVGRLIFRVNNAWIDQAGRKSASIFGSVTREFDGFFDGRW